MDIRLFFDYNYWASGRILSAASRLSLDQFAAPAPVSFGSLRGTLVHIVGTEYMWRQRCQKGISPPAMPKESEFPDLDSLTRFWNEEQQAMRQYLDSLQDSDFEQIIHYTTTKGVPYENVLAHLLLHVVNHSTQFRAEAGVVCTMFGQSPGDWDLIVYLREKGLK